MPAGPTAKPTGFAIKAPVPFPSAKPFSLPATVVTTPPGVNLRMRLLYQSAKKTLPMESTATPQGPHSDAPVPVPSANAAEPLPASVLTTPPGVTLRMRLFDESPTITLPLESKATPKGLLNLAAVPVPSDAPDTPPLPASVVTTPKGVTLRIR